MVRLNYLETDYKKMATEFPVKTIFDFITSLLYKKSE